MNNKILIKLTLLFSIATVGFSSEKPTYAIVDTGQKNYFDDNSYIKKPKEGKNFFGQDSSYLGNQPNFSNNQDGTITDNITNLMWSKSHTKKLTWDEALDYARYSKASGFNDWRIPTIKELYSLIDFNGKTGTGKHDITTVPYDAKPYINTSYFDFEYPNEKRYIDAQYWTKTDYVSTTMNGAKTFFGVNFADGRIKGYPKFNKGNKGSTKFYLRLVRGNSSYGKNNFEDKEDGTILDNATKLLWMKDDSKKGMNWKSAISYCENLDYANKVNWRIPNAKELQSIVDYTKSPDTTSSAAIDSIFNSTSIKNEQYQKDFPFYWTGTTHLDGKRLGSNAVYISFGRALGFMKDRRTNTKELLDVHGAGAQRSDPKSGNISKFAHGRGPQGDVLRIENFVRCVSDDFTKVNKSNDYKVYSSNIESKQKFSFNQNMREKNDLNTDFKKDNSSRMNKFDRNNDNKISYAEAPKKMKENFNRHDLNSDGFIDIDEIKTLPRPKQ